MSDLREYLVAAAIAMTAVVAVIWAAGALVGLLALAVRLLRGK